uniref:Pre-mRNA splicing Prp18-interacting factor n=1 Tax=Tanacetum cinerariifolium TaxID=118510 RepID=A0A699IHY8_TANCI|nr:hypothetical protein [Tanacetum cinerariifolium]
MASFDYRLNPLYPIKECSSCGALYTTDYCCSEGSLRDKIICDLDKIPDLSQQPPQNCPKCGNPVDGHTNVVNALQKPFVIKQDPGENSSQSPPQINHYCCFECGDSLEDIFCHKCTCELCERGAHYGYNCPPKVLVVPDLEPFNNQTSDELSQTVPSFDPTCYSEDGNSFTYDSISNLVHESPNDFDPPLQPPIYSYEFCGNDAYYDEFIKSSVESLVPISSESEGVPDNLCDVPFHDNSLPLDVSKDQFENFFDSNDESSSNDDDSFSIDNIEYVEASPLNSELVRSEVWRLLSQK